MTRETKTLTVVHCAKYDEELPALERVPFPGPLGQRIFENISKFAYAQWTIHQTNLINHYGLNMADPRTRDLIFEQMEAFFFGEGDVAPVSGGQAKK